MERIHPEVSLEVKGIQMCRLRNEIRTTARDLMADRLQAKAFDITDPHKTYEQVLRNASKKGHKSEEGLSKYVIESAKRTREKYNIRYGKHPQKPTQKPQGKQP